MRWQRVGLMEVPLPWKAHCIFAGTARTSEAEVTGFHPIAGAGFVFPQTKHVCSKLGLLWTLWYLSTCYWSALEMGFGCDDLAAN